MKTVLTIAGFDPSSGAGITADLMVFAAHGLFGTSAITALTVQSTLGVKGNYPIDAAVLGETLDCLVVDLPPMGVKIGMVGVPANISRISQYLIRLKQLDSERGSIPVVLDPIIGSSSGRRLLAAEGIQALMEGLLPLVDWVTPNADELEVLTGHELRSGENLAAAARELQAQVGPRLDRGRIGVLAKGGHLEKPDDLLLTPDGDEHWLAGERIETKATHGTGCALSSAFLSRLVLGDRPTEAGRKAKEYVVEAMRRAPGIGQGKGPMELLWPLRGERR